MRRLILLVLFISCTPSPRYSATGDRGSSETATTQTSPTRSSKGGVFEKGGASWYGRPYHGRTTASGERYDMNEMTAAHKTLAFGTMVEVRDIQSGNTVTVRITDRGPFVKGRVIDLSRKAASRLGIIDAGVATVELRIK